MAIKNGQFREAGNIGYSSGRKPNQKHNTTCVGHHYAQKTQITKIRHESSYELCVYLCVFDVVSN